MYQLQQSLLDILHELRDEPCPLTVGGGFGLYLKRLHCDQNGERTLFQELPQPRATNDLDLFIRAELLAEYSRVERLRLALARLGFEALDEAKYMHWARKVEVNGDQHDVKIDLLVGPLGEYRDRLHVKKPRVRPKEPIDLHARSVDEALRIDESPFPIQISGTRSGGEHFQGVVYVPHAFPYLMMKLTAHDDRKNDTNKGLGRHHALDVYTVVGLMTEGEYEESKRLSAMLRNDPYVFRVRSIVANDFFDTTSLGILRLREHDQFHDGFRVGEMIGLLRELFPHPSA
jgi:hypothetical protein